MNNKLYLHKILIYFFLLLTLPVIGKSQFQISNKINSEIDNIDSEIPELMAVANVPGLSIAVVEKGKLVWSKAYGIASSELKRKATTETIFEAASLGNQRIP